MLIPVFIISFFIKCFRKYKCCNRSYKKLAKKLYWSIVLRTIIESYVIGLICCFINAMNLDFSREDTWTLINAILTVIIGPLLILFPVIAASYMAINWNHLDTMEVSYGELYHGFNIRGSKTMLIFWLSDFLRKQILILIATMYTDSLWLQIQAVFYLSIIMIILGGTLNVRNSSYAKKMDIFNEVRLILIMYHMILFTMFVPELDMRENIGYSCSSIVVMGLLFNMS